MWKMRIDGRLFHSGLPHKVTLSAVSSFHSFSVLLPQGINSIELGLEAISHVQEKFFKDFPAVSDFFFQAFIPPFLSPEASS